MFSIQYSRVEFFGGGRELLGSPNLLSIRPKRGPTRAVLHLLIEWDARLEEKECRSCDAGRKENVRHG
jgi:hypothetical protein